MAIWIAYVQRQTSVSDTSLFAHTKRCSRLVVRSTRLLPARTALTVRHPVIDCRPVRPFAEESTGKWTKQPVKAGGICPAIECRCALPLNLLKRVYTPSQHLPKRKFDVPYDWDLFHRYLARHVRRTSLRSRCEPSKQCECQYESCGISRQHRIPGPHCAAGLL